MLLILLVIYTEPAKCDEKRPQCSNCTRHGSDCSFGLQFSQSSPNSSSQDGCVLTPHSSTHASSPSGTFDTPASGPTNPAHFGSNNSQVLNIADLELMHNYNASASFTIASNPDLQTFMRVNVPQIGFSYPFLLNGVLAVSALHISKFKQGDARARYQSQAQQHYEKALRTASALLPDKDEDTCPPLYLFTTICVFFTLGAGPKPNDFLLFGDRGLAEWLVLFRGLEAISKQNLDFLLGRSEISPIFSISNRMINREPHDNERLQKLRQQIMTTSSGDPDLQIYLKALNDLSKSFPPGTLQERRAKETSPQYVFVWMHRLTDDFINCLQKKNPVSLAILAHFCVLLNDLSAFWWVRGWPEHLISEIYSSLNGEYRMWLRWPMEEIGWIPE